MCLQSAGCSAGKWLVLAGLRWLALAHMVSQSPADQLGLVPVTDTGSKRTHMGLQGLFRPRHIVTLTAFYRQAARSEQIPGRRIDST